MKIDGGMRKVDSRPLLRMSGARPGLDRHVATVAQALRSLYVEPAWSVAQVDPRDVLRKQCQDLLDRVATVVNAESCSLFLYEAPTGRLVRLGITGLRGNPDDTEEYRVGQSLVGKAFVSSQSLLVNGLANHPDAAKDALSRHSLLAPSRDIQAAVYVRLATRSEIHGVLRFANRVDGTLDNGFHFSQKDSDQLELICRHVEKHLEVIYERYQSAELLRFATQIAGSLDQHVICAQSLDPARRLANASAASLYLKQPDDNTDLHLEAITSFRNPDLVRRAPLAASITGRTFRTGEMQFVPDLLADPEVHSPRVAEAEDFRSACCLPLRSSNDVVGTLNIFFRLKADLGVITLNNLAQLSCLVGAAIEKARSYGRSEALEIKLGEAAHSMRSPLHRVRMALLTFRRTLCATDLEKTEHLLQQLDNDVARAIRYEETFLISHEGAVAVRQLDIARVDVSAVLLALVEGLTARARERGLTIALYDSAKKLPSVRGDRLLLELVFHNLLENALKYAWEKTVIKVHGQYDGGTVRVTVEDEGLGIPPEFRALIFDGYARSPAKDQKRFIPGTGLGLRIVKEIISAHGGSVEAQSTPFLNDPARVAVYEGFRTSFVVTIPRVVRSAAGQGG